MLIRQTRQAVRAINQSIFLKCLWVVQRSLCVSDGKKDYRRLTPGKGKVGKALKTNVL